MELLLVMKEIIVQIVHINISSMIQKNVFQAKNAQQVIINSIFNVINTS